MAAEVVAVLPEGIRGDEPGFYIVSEANEKVMEVEKANPKPGAEVTTGKKKEGRELHQLWYKDAEGIIRSKLNHFAIDAHENKEKVHMRPFTKDARQLWIVEGNKIVNRTFCNECLDIKGGLRPRSNDDIVARPFEDKKTQHWRIELI
jgi:hypothetical protein